MFTLPFGMSFYDIVKSFQNPKYNSHSYKELNPKYVSKNKLKSGFSKAVRKRKRKK